MTQQEFNEISKRYLDGKTTEAEEKSILAWFVTQPELNKTNPPGEQSLKASKRVWNNLRKEIQLSSKGRKMRIAWLVGTAVCLLLGYIYFVATDTPEAPHKQIKPHTPMAHRGIELKNNTYSDQKVTLSDGSLVVLEPGSSLIYNNNYNRVKRELYLHGEAFFKVNKNPSKPFIVHVGKITAEVIGTSFTIKNTRDSKGIEVDVLTGKVSVYAKSTTPKKPGSANEKMGVVLTPNQRVQYLNFENRLVKSIVESPTVVITKEEFAKLTFVNAPISQVFEAIEKAYGLTIIYDEEVMQECIMTTSLDEENLLNKLTIICKLLNASYEMVDAQIVITSNGCQ